MNVLILSPHVDDGELGCGGVVARLAEEEGHVVRYIAFTACDVDPIEVKLATSTLGIASAEILSFRARRFCERRQDILDRMILLRDAGAPDVVFCPASTALHQDHQIVHAEAMRAFRHSSIFGFDNPWDNVTFNATGFWRLQGRHVSRKVAALACYESQKERPYMSEAAIFGLAKTRGVMCGAPFAEAFEVLRSIR